MAIDFNNMIAVSRKKAAALFDISASTFDSWVKEGLLPEGKKVNGLRRWSKEKLEESWQKIDGEEEINDKENPFDNITF